MFTRIRTSMFAIAAVAALGAASLITTTTSADASRFGGGGGGLRGGGMGGGHAMVRGGGVRIGGGGMRVGMRHVGIRHVGIRHVGIRHHIHRPHLTLRPHWCHRFPWRCKVGVRWPRPWVIPVATAGLVATSYAVAPAVAAAPRPCTCLTKEYTPDNLVVFKDLCTKEVASAPAGNTQALLPAPQAQGAPTTQQ
jgi:hypothetical protein